MAGVFQPNVFQNNVFQVDAAPGTVCTGTAWGGSWGTSWMEAWGGTCAVPNGGSAWACTWSRAWLDAWGDTSSCDVVIPPSPPPPTPGPLTGGAGWISPRRKPLPKKKRTLLEELDDHLIELRSRIEEEPEPDLEVVRAYRAAEAFATSELIADYTTKDIRARLIIVREMIREMDDEEAILLAIH
jgi:hypothetical protein